MAPKLPKAILFDAGGTLYENEHLNFEANRRTAHELYDFNLTWELYDTQVRRGQKVTYNILEDTGISVDSKRYLALKQQYFEELVTEQLKPLPGVHDFLKWANEQNIQCIVVSAARRSTLTITLKALDIGTYFSGSVCLEDADKYQKPNPYPYAFGLKIAEVTAQEAVAVEDSAKGIISAQAAGIFTVGIHNRYNVPADLSEADYTIKHFSELRDYLSTKYHD